MKIRIFIAVILLAVFISAFSQDERYYHTLKFPAETIRSNLENEEFDYFKFSFHHKFFSGFVLERSSYRKDSSLIPGTTFVLDKEEESLRRKLRNVERGTLILSRNKMKNNGMDGTFSCILKPKKSKEDTGQEQDYVSYRVKRSNRLLRTLNVEFTEFDCDPSPPFNVE